MSGRRMAKDKESSRVERVRSALERYEGPLVRYAARLTGDLDSARDVVQDTFLKLCSVGPLPEDNHLAAWLFTVCRNRALDVVRREKRVSPASEASVEDVASPAPSPSAVLEKRETSQNVLQLLEALPQNQQEVIRLKFQEGLSYREISQVTGHSVGNVGFLIHTGIKAIRENLKDDA